MCCRVTQYVRKDSCHKFTKIALSLMAEIEDLFPQTPPSTGNKHPFSCWVVIVDVLFQCEKDCLTFTSVRSDVLGLMTAIKSLQFPVQQVKGSSRSFLLFTLMNLWQCVISIYILLLDEGSSNQFDCIFFLNCKKKWRAGVWDKTANDQAAETSLH